MAKSFKELRGKMNPERRQRDAAEGAFLSPSVQTLLEQQGTLEDFARRYRASIIDLGADAATRLTLAGVSVDLVGNAGLDAAELHRHLAEATGAVDYASKWVEIQRTLYDPGMGPTRGMTSAGRGIPLALLQSAGQSSLMSSPSTDLMVSRIHFCTLLVSRRAFVFALKQSIPPSLTFATSRSCFLSCFFPPAG
jgi:hypothetical protein